MAELIAYKCPRCGRGFKEMRGPLMSDMGTDRAEKRERRRQFMRGFRDRVRGIERHETPEGREDIYAFPEFTCRRCGVPMEQAWGAMVD